MLACLWWRLWRVARGVLPRPPKPQACAAVVPPQWAAFEDEHGIYLCTEYASKGDVFTDVERRGGSLTEPEAVRQVIHPFLSALIYLHGRKIMHRCASST
eukprot:366230-Chlamydomonas_euryale.AAC.2